MRAFYGRLAIQLEYLATVGDRLPGTTGAEAVGGLMGKVPDDIGFSPTRRRYPVVAWRLPSRSPRSGADSPQRTRYRRLVARADRGLGRARPRAATATFAEAVGASRHVLTVHSLGLLCSVRAALSGALRPGRGARESATPAS